MDDIRACAACKCRQLLAFGIDGPLFKAQQYQYQFNGTVLYYIMARQDKGGCGWGGAKQIIVNI